MNGEQSKSVKPSPEKSGEASKSEKLSPAKSGKNVRKARGDAAEAETARFLEARGFTILARQWRCRFGELDIVALAPENVICFVEVKYRGRNTIAAPREFVDGRKQARLRAAAELWLYANAPDAPARFDVAEVVPAPDGSLLVTYWTDAFS